ncbi:MAG: hypothetical protein ACI9CF_000864 [Candidatus Omnitrophota bacterium]|jgi:hypothetical protein
MNHSSTQNANKNQKFFKKVSLVVAFLYTFGCIIPQASYASYEDDMLGMSMPVTDSDGTGTDAMNYTTSYLKTMNDMTEPEMNAEALASEAMVEDSVEEMFGEEAEYEDLMATTETETTTPETTTADVSGTEIPAAFAATETESESTEVAADTTTAPETTTTEAPSTEVSSADTTAPVEPVALLDSTPPPPVNNRSVTEARADRKALREQIALEGGYVQTAINDALTSIDDVITEIKRFIEPAGSSLADAEITALEALDATLEAVIFASTSSIEDQTNASMDRMAVQLAIDHWKLYIANQKEAIASLEKSKHILTGNCGSSRGVAMDLCGYRMLSISPNIVDRGNKQGWSIERQLKRTGWERIAGADEAKLKRILQEVQGLAALASTVVATFDFDWDESQTSDSIKQGLMTQF